MAAGLYMVYCGNKECQMRNSIHYDILFDLYISEFHIKKTRPVKITYFNDVIKHIRRDN